MLKRMQEKYSEKPVRFLVVPCNQFMNQEPGSNAEVKAFAEKSIQLGPGSNVIMLAKSNLNGVSCETAGEGACTAASAECCPANDVVYDYLLPVTPPSTIKWNFDKIITDVDGRPFDGETITHGGDLDDKLDGVIDALLEKARTQERPPPAAELVQVLSGLPSSSVPSIVAFLAKPACAFGFFAAWFLVVSRRGRTVSGPRLLDDAFTASDVSVS